MQLPGHADLLAREGRSQRRNRRLEALCGQGDHVHVALHDVEGACRPHGLAGLMQVVQGAAFLEYEGLP